MSKRAIRTIVVEVPLVLAWWKLIVMFAGGIAGSLLVGLVIWLVVPTSFAWFGREAILTAVLFSVGNLVGTAPKGKQMDGAAILALLTQRTPLLFTQANTPLDANRIE
jgi:hypothetical protein